MSAPVLLDWIADCYENLAAAVTNLKNRFTGPPYCRSYKNNFDNYLSKFDPENSELWTYPDGEDGDPFPPAPPNRSQMNAMMIQNGKAIMDLKKFACKQVKVQYDLMAKLSNTIDMQIEVINGLEERIDELRKDVDEIYKSEAALEVGLKRSRADGPSA